MANKNFKARIGIEAPLVAADNGTTALTLTGANVVAEGTLDVTGNLTVTSNTIKSSSATALSLSGADVTVAGDLRINGNDIKASNGTTAITLSSANVTVAGDLTVNDAVVFDGSTSGTVTIAAPAVAGTQSYTLPTALPAVNGYVLSGTTGGELSWVSNSDANTTYDFAATSTTGGANLNLTGSDSTTDTVKLSNGTGVTVAQVSGTEVSVAIGQAVGTGDSPSFAGVTGGNITIGVATDNTIATTSGDLILDSASGTLQLSDATLSSPVAQTWNIVDNTAAALTINTTGKTGLISIDTTNSSETISMSGNLQVDSGSLNRFTRTATGTGSNATIAVNRTRTDGARAVDGGPWYAFEYVGTDNTQATSLQNAIRSRYQTSGNHVVQFIQAAGDYATVTAIGQIARGATSFNNTSGGNMLALTDTTATLRGTTTSITNSGNTTTYASFTSTAHTIGNIDGVTGFVRTSGATAGSRPVVTLRNSVTTTAAPATGDGAAFRQLVSGSNGTVYNLTQISGIYNTSGDSSISFDVANGDQTGATMTTVRPFETSLSTTVIKATASPTATPGGNTLSTVATFTSTGATLTGDLAVNGGDITTTAGTATLFNTGATNLSIGGAATTLALGAATGSTTIANDIFVKGTGADNLLYTSGGTVYMAAPYTSGFAFPLVVAGKRTDNVNPQDGDIANIQYKLYGSGANSINLGTQSMTYDTGGNNSIDFFLENNAGPSVVTNPLSISAVQTTIRAGTNASVSDIATFSDTKILNSRATRNAITTATVTEGGTYTPAATDNNSISLTINTGSGTTIIDLINLTGQGTGGMYTIMVYNNAATGTPIQVKNTRINTNNLTTHTIPSGERIMVTAYIVGDYATSEHLVVA